MLPRFDSGRLAVWVEPKSSWADQHWWLMAQMWLQVGSSWLWMTLTQLSHGSCHVWQSPDYCPLLPRQQPTFLPASHLFYWPDVTMTMDEQCWSIGPLFKVLLYVDTIYLYLHCWHNTLFYGTLVVHVSILEPREPMPMSRTQGLPGALPQTPGCIPTLVLAALHPSIKCWLCYIPTLVF